VIFGILLAFVRSKVSFVQTIDHSVARHLNEFAVRHHGAVRAGEWVSTLGGPRTFYVLAAVLTVISLVRHAYRLAIWAAVTMAGAALLDVLLKNAVSRARPHFDQAVALAPGKSFPSGHALESFVGCGILLLATLPAMSIAWRRVALIAATVIVVAIGFSRVLLGVHYLSDVVGAWIFAAAWLAATVAAFRLWRGTKRKDESAHGAGLDAADTNRLVSQ
jgi:undecaprenyl-diphosphatase